jgi:hypothetical protein
MSFISPNSACFRKRKHGTGPDERVPWRPLFAAMHKTL